MRTVLLALLTIVLIVFVWIGYLGGSPFASVDATAPARGVRRQAVAIFLSGDMGSHIGMGPRISARLAADGIPVLDINSLTYFRTRRTPEEATRLIVEAMDHARARWPDRPRILLIGQSYGADMLHVGLAGLPTGLRRRVAFVGLVVPGATVEYRASPGEIFTFLMRADDALPSARQLRWVPALCVHGLEERDSLCPLVRSMPNMQVRGLPGGHPLHHDPAPLHAVLLEAIDAALGRERASASVK
jgi:type IV secretory pathway VirJ component